MTTFLNSFPMPPPPLSELSSLPLPEVESWFDPSEYSQASSSNNQCAANAASANCSSAVFPVSASVSATPSNCQLGPNHVHRQSSIFPNLNVLPVSVYVEKSRTDTAPPATQLSVLPLENANKSTMLALDEDCSGTVLDQLQLHETSALNVQRAANLSPLSDVSSPSDFEAHSHSPFSPQSFPTNDSESCCTALPGVYSSILGATEESDSRSTSPSLASDDELSQINQSVYEEKLDTPLPAAIAPQASLFPLLNLNANTETHSEASAAAAVNARGECPKVESTKNSKSKRSRRRNLIRALKEQSADGNYSGSEGEVMNSQPCAPARSKRSYIALLGDEGKALDGEDDECKASSGSKRDRNKASASAYRKRRKIYLDTLEARVASLNECVKAKDEELTKLHSENRVLKEQVSFLKRLINFKATDEELKETATDNALAQNSTTSSVALSNSSSSAFGISNSRLSFGPQFSSNGSSRHATLFLFVLFCCFLLFNPLWTGMDLSAGVSDSSSLSMPVGRLGRSLLAFDNTAISAQMASSSAAAAPHPYLLSSAVVKEVNEAAQLRFFEEEAAKDVEQIIPSNKQENSSIPSDGTSVSSTSDQNTTNSNNLRAFSELAARFDMAPNSQQFAELVASAYLPLVSILGEAATQAALRELATGVFFIQQHALLQAVTHAVNTNLTTLSK